MDPMELVAAGGRWVVENPEWAEAAMEYLPTTFVNDTRAPALARRELKFFDFSLTQDITATADELILSTALANISEGTGPSDRMKRNITVTKLSVRLLYKVDTFSTGQGKVRPAIRFLVYIDKVHNARPSSSRSPLLPLPRFSYL